MWHQLQDMAKQNLDCRMSKTASKETYSNKTSYMDHFVYDIFPSDVKVDDRYTVDVIKRKFSFKEFTWTNVLTLD